MTWKRRPEAFQALPIEAALTGPRPRLDPRQHVDRPGVVDIALAGTVAAAAYTAPWRTICRAPRTAMRSAPIDDAAAVSELLFGESFDVFDIVRDWAFGRRPDDGYTGWVALTALDDGVAAGDSRISARVAPIFLRPDIKAPVILELPFGSRISGVEAGNFVALSAGFVHRRHLATPPGTPFAVARIFVGAPYLWGGRTPLGVDCSGLVQAALAACGIDCPRDSDQQREQLGSGVDFAARRGGDLVFFPGHVGILVDADTLFHANAHWMSTVEEPLADVIARGAEVIAVRRV